MKLHVICRSIGPENRKNRPAFYDKTLALASLVRAAENSGIPTELIFVNDGPIQSARLDVQALAGEIFPVSCGSNRASMRRVLQLPRERGWAGGDLVWFAEDDYLYTADAFAAVVAAARQLSRADYFAIYSELRFDPTATRGSPRFDARRRADGDPDAVTLGRVRWYHAVSTTATYGTRVCTLLADEMLLRNAPYVGGAWDHATFLALQGYRPFGVNELGGAPLEPGQASAVQGLARRAALTGARLALDAAALARPERARRVMVGSDPDLATHLEEEWIAPGTDWAAETVVLAEWLRDYRASKGSPLHA